MQCKNTTATALAVISVACLMALVPAMDVSGADATYDKDYGTFYSYTIGLVFDGADAETIEWDFGDGSPVSNDWNTSHTYAAKGEYIITQTTTNSFEGGSTTVERYRVYIAGFPVISFESNGGPLVPDIEQTAYNVTAERPVDPTREGYTFDGWFTDPSLTDAMDWSAGIVRSMTLYAKWTETSTPVDPTDPTDPVDPIDPVDPPATATYTVTFDVTGGSVAIPKVTTEGGSFVIPGYTGSKDGFEFEGWSIDGVTYQPGQSITVSGNITLSAVWSPVQDAPGQSDGSKDDSDGSGFPWYVCLLIVIVVLVALGYFLYRRYQMNGGW